jgi:FkbM family methyltransferase
MVELRKRLGSIRRLVRRPQPVFGHHALNDRWAIELVFPGLRHGYFVEAGACEGGLGSASRVLERNFGWNGVCVEPVDHNYQRLCQFRSCDTDPRCLYDRTGETVEFLTYDDALPLSGIRALNKNDTGPAQHDTSGTTIEKDTVSLRDLLREHHAPSTVEYLCLDVEGAEATILGAFDFDADYRILAISVEGERCDSLLAARGYVRASNPFAPRPVIDHYFLHPSVTDRLQGILMP